MEENQSYGPINSSQMIAEEPQSRHNYRMIFITIIVLLIALGGFIVLTNDGFKGKMQEALHLISPKVEENTNSEELELFSSEIKDRTIPWIEVKPPKDDATVGEDISVYIHGYSGNKDIVGYDLLIGIDPAQFEVMSISSELPDFQISQFDRGMYQAVTGIKNLQSKEPTLFNDTPLLKIVVKPKNKGEGVITVLSSKGQERTQFLDKDVVIIEPQVGSIFIRTN